VRSLIVPIFLYSDVVYFLSLTGAEFRRLELAFNACSEAPGNGSNLRIQLLPPEYKEKESLVKVAV
jgi:hypothetical protein